MILEGKKILITGVVNRHSIAFAIAERAQAQGAEVLLTSFGRVKRMTERSAARLDPGEPARHPRHQVLEYQLPPGRVYAVAHGHRLIFGCRHN